jgi:hypothetical protein
VTADVAEGTAGAAPKAEERVAQSKPAGAEEPLVAEKVTEAEKAADASTEAAEEAEEAKDAAENDAENAETTLVESDPMLRRVNIPPPSGGRARSLTNHGNMITGNDNLFLLVEGKAQQSAMIKVEAISGLDERIASFVEPDVFGALRLRLRRYPVVDFIGPARSGRFTTACVALARRYERCLEIILPPGADPYDIRKWDGLISEGHGYVIRLPHGWSEGLIRWLTPAFEKAKAGAILVRSREGRQEAHHGAEVRHEAPDPVRVFRKHLIAGFLGQCLGCAGPCQLVCTDEYVRRLTTMPDVIKSIGGLLEPRVCADYARRFTEARPQTDDDILSLLPAADEQRRVQARRILLMSEADGRHADRYDQHRRALRIAYATLSGRPAAQVSVAAGMLLERVDEHFGREYTGRPALTHDVSLLLGDELTAATAPREAAQYDEAGAHAHDDLVLAILGVAWNDFEHTQPALMEWVQDLASHPATEFRLAATRAAMVFAYHDFDLLWERVIGSWAAHPSRRLRRVAAATLVSSANLPATAPSLSQARLRTEVQVERVLYRLAFSDRANERDTAALAWAEGYPARQQRTTAYALTSVALRCSSWRAGAVAEAVVRIADFLGVAWTVSLLDAWLRREEEALRHQAARSFFTLTMEALRDRDRHHAFLDTLAQEPALVRSVASLWQNLLATKVDGAPHEVAWRILALWLRGAREPRYAHLARHILRRLAQDPGIQPRLAYWLSNGTRECPKSTSDDQRLQEVP